MTALGPLILTAELPRDLQGWATRLRDAHFPPERNFLAAHVTLFHALPPQMEPELVGYFARLCRDTRPVPAQIEGVMSLGRGTALKLSSPGMLALREEIADHCHGMLTAQDQGQPLLHITIQNKVEPDAARALQAELAQELSRRSFDFRGLALHRYLGGPWELIKSFAFRS